MISLFREFRTIYCLGVSLPLFKNMPGLHVRIFPVSHMPHGEQGGGGAGCFHNVAK